MPRRPSSTVTYLYMPQAPDRIGVATLPFEGKNQVVYLLPQARDKPAAGRAGEEGREQPLAPSADGCLPCEEEEAVAP